MGEVQYAGEGGGRPLPVVDPELLDAGTAIVCPIKSSESAGSPLLAASVSAESPFALAIDQRLSPGVTTWEAVVPEELDEDAESTPAEASAAAPSASVGIWIVSPA